MSGLGRRFDPGELGDAGNGPLRDTEVAGLLATARDLEEFARAESAMPTVGFEDRVMAAVAREPAPVLVANGGFLPGLITAVRDAWRIIWSGGRPLAVRAQALALVLLVAIAAGSVGTLGAVGAARFFSSSDATPVPTPTIDQSQPPVSSDPLLPSVLPSPSPSVLPSPSPSESPEPSESPSASERAEPTGTDNGSGATSSPTRTPPPTIRPTGTPRPTQTPDPTRTPDPTGTDDSHETPSPTPSDTPDPSGGSSG